MLVTVDVTDKVIFIRLLVQIQHELLDDRLELCSVTEASIRFTIHPHAVTHQRVRVRPACRKHSTNKHTCTPSLLNVAPQHGNVQVHA